MFNSVQICVYLLFACSSIFQDKKKTALSLCNFGQHIKLFSCSVVETLLLLARWHKRDFVYVTYVKLLHLQKKRPKQQKNAIRFT